MSTTDKPLPQLIAELPIPDCPESLGADCVYAHRAGYRQARSDAVGLAMAALADQAHPAPDDFTHIPPKRVFAVRATYKHVGPLPARHLPGDEETPQPAPELLDPAAHWPCASITVDARGNITAGTLYAPGLPEGLHDVWPGPVAQPAPALPTDAEPQRRQLIIAGDEYQVTFLPGNDAEVLFVGPAAAPNGAMGQHPTRRTAPAPVVPSDAAAVVNAAKEVDWLQIALNGGPPCFHLEGGRFCLRAWRWDGHNCMHKFVSFDALLSRYGNQAGGLEREAAVRWAVERWHAEVANRPLINVHRRSLDDTWRQVMRHFGGDPVTLVGPDHSELLAADAQPAEGEGK